jgi:hypothetical protein
MVLAFLLAGNASVFAQNATQQFTSEKFNYSFQYPDSYTASTTSASWREEVTLLRNGELALVTTFVTFAPADAPVTDYKDLLKTKGTVLCQYLCLIEPTEDVVANGIQGVKFSLQTRPSSGSALLVDPFPGTSLYAFNVHPGSPDLLILTPVSADATDALNGILETISVPAPTTPPPAGTEEVVDPATLPPPEGGTQETALPEEEQLLFGLFSTQLSTTQYLALGIAVVCCVTFIILRIRDKRLAAKASPAFYQQK